MANVMKNVILRSILLLTVELATAAPMQPVSSIQETVSNYLNANLDPEGKYEIGIMPIDPRLQLPQCDQNLQVFSQSGEIKPGRNTLGVRCQGEKGWTIYSTVSLKSFREVLILNQSLRRNDIIRADHLGTELRDVGLLPQGYLTDPAVIIGKQASRNIPAGSVLNRLHYADLTLVRRGERVNIQSARAGLMISAIGMAMADGTKGQRINVKNLSSQRVIQATVVDPGQVSVYF